MICKNGSLLKPVIDSSNFFDICV